MTTLIENIVQAVADNAALIAWCTEQYEAEQTVQLGVNFDQLPDLDDYPIVMIAQMTGKEGKVLPEEVAVIAVTCGIADEAAPVVSGRLKKYSQVLDLESFRKLVLTAIEAADLKGGYVAEVDLENDPVELFPIFSTNMFIRIQCPAPMRGRWEK